MFDIAPTLDCRGRALVLDRVRIMGVLNVTPDSFSDGGQFLDHGAAVAHALRLAAEGADLIDVGGESTRPGSTPVDAETELARVLPVIKALAPQLSIPIAVDTSKPEVMKAAVDVGAGMINDVWALRQPGAIEAAAALGVPVCLMHMQGEPTSMQSDPQYLDVVGEVHQFLADRILACQFAGIDQRRLLADPGFGFGKTLAHNLLLLRNLDRFKSLGVPLLVGLSRKGMIGTLTGDAAAGDRVHGSVAAALIAAARGAAIVRVHDVAATRAALAVFEAVRASATASSTGAARDKARRGWLLEED